MKERFELMEEELQYWIFDKATSRNYHESDFCWLVDLLNEQDEKIKELEKEIKQLKFDCSMYKSVNYLINELGIDKTREIMFQSEKELQQRGGETIDDKK